jgi:hypothetical protein
MSISLTASDCDGMYVYYTVAKNTPLPTITSGATLQQVSSAIVASGGGVARLTELVVASGGQAVANTGSTMDKIPEGSYVRAISLVKLGCDSATDIGYDYTVLSGSAITAVPANGTVTLIDTVN